MSASWAEFAGAAPELAAAVRGRFESNQHHVIGTIRPNGAPRLSGTEVHVVGEHLTLGMMVDSRKLADVRKDPRVEIHCAPLVTAPDGHDMHDVKVAGTLVATGPTDGPEGTAFRVDLARVSAVRVEGDELVIDTWDPDRGAREIRRH